MIKFVVKTLAIIVLVRFIYINTHISESERTEIDRRCRANYIKELERLNRM